MAHLPGGSWCCPAVLLSSVTGCRLHSTGGFLFLKVSPDICLPSHSAAPCTFERMHFTPEPFRGGLWGWPVSLPWLGLTLCLTPEGCQGTEGAQDGEGE